MSSAVWICNINDDLSLLKQTDIKKTLQEYFKGVDFHGRAYDNLAYCKRIGKVMG